MFKNKNIKNIQYSFNDFQERKKDKRLKILAVAIFIAYLVIILIKQREIMALAIGINNGLEAQSSLEIIFLETIKELECENV